MTHCGATDNLSELVMKTVDLLANVNAKEVFKCLHFIQYQVQQIANSSIVIKLIKLSTYLPINYLVIYLPTCLPTKTN